MTFKYISPKELKAFEKERMGYMKQAEKALKSEDLEQVIVLFKKIVEVSEKMDDSQMVAEFTQKLKLLTQGSSVNVADQFELAQTTIEDFIGDLMKAPYKILKGVSEKIAVEEEKIEAAPVKETVSVEVVDPTRIDDYDVTSIEAEIRQRGTIQDQLGDLKKILKDKKEEYTPNV